MNHLRQIFALSLATLTVALPEAGVLTRVAEAADLPDSNAPVELVCPPVTASGSLPIEGLPNEDGSDASISDTTFVSESALADTIYAESVKSIFDTVGRYDAEKKGWTVCTADVNNYLGLIPLSEQDVDYLETATLPYERIEFKNRLDRYAILGEPCTKFVALNQCDETTEVTPVPQTDPATGDPLYERDVQGNLVLENGLPKPVYQTEPVLDANGNPVYNEDGTAKTQVRTESQPKYFTEIWPNGKWDAPHADVRIAKLLTYLVTPSSQGGAGRDQIKVSKITQVSEKDGEFPAEGTDEDSEANDENLASAHSYGHNGSIAQALDISEIDNTRITTKVTKRKRVGGSSVSYTYNSFPIKVAWQSDEGMQQAGVPYLSSLNIYDGAKTSFNAVLLQLLDEMDVDDLDLDAGEIDLNSLGDFTEAIGGALLAQLLNSSNGSLAGWDAASTLERFGRIYLANQLNLNPNAFLEGDTQDELSQNVGRVTTETALGLSNGSLKGATSADILTSIGRRYLEEKVFKVSSGTLVPSDGFPIASRDDLIVRLGEGRLEKRFGLKPQSLRVASLEAAMNANLKVRTIFASDAASNAYVNSTMIDDDLGLAIDTDTNSYGYTKQQFESATEKVIAGKGSAEAFLLYKRLIGSRVVESGIGSFNARQIAAADRPSITAGSESTGGTSDTATSNFATSFLSQFTDANGAPLLDLRDLAYEYGISGAGRDSGFLAKYVTSYVRPRAAATVASSTLGRALTATFGSFQIISADDLTTLLIDCIIAQVSGRFVLQNSSTTQAHALLKDLTTPTSGWRDRFTLLKNFTDAYVEVVEAEPNGTIPAEIASARETLTQTVSQIDSFISGLERTQGMLNQSGQSAALDLPGILYAVEEDGTLTDTKLYEGDPVTAILSGNLNILPVLGRVILGKAVAGEKGSQTQVAGSVNLLKPGALTTQIDRFVNGGVGDALFRNRGFQEGDFDRIFTFSMGAEVFQRIGELEILRSAWDKGDIDSKIGQAITSNQGYQQALVQINKGIQAIEFYTVRLASLQQLAQEIEEEARKVDGLLNPETIEAIAAERTKPGKKQSEIEKQAQRFEILFNQAKACIGSSAPCQVIKAKAETGLHTIREIIAGHSLSFSQSTGNGSTSPAQYGGTDQACWTKNTIRQVLTSGDIQKRMSTLAVDVAGCQIDRSLNLPDGAIAKWYASGDMDSYEHFLLAVGLAQSGDPRSVQTVKGTGDAAAIKRIGERSLGTRGLVALARLNPTFGALASRYGLTGEDMFRLLRGDTTAIFRKIGGGKLDEAFNWEPGTGADLVAPVCYKDEYNPRPSQTVRCTSDQATNKRLRAAAQVGLQALGLELDFPVSFRLNAGGNFLGNYGNSLISETLGIAENSFRGSFTDVVNRNDPTVIAAALGLTATPYEQSLLSLRNRLKLSLNRENAYSSESFATRSAIDRIDDTLIAWSQSRLVGATGIGQASGPGYTLNWAGSFDRNTCSVNDPTSAATLAVTDGKVYRDTLLSLQNTFSSSVGPTVNNAVSNLLLSINEGSTQDSDTLNEFFIKAYASRYQQQLGSFRCRVANLDVSYGIADGSFQRFITGAIAADEITRSIGDRELAGKLVNSYLDTHIKDPAIREALTTFQVLTMDASSCPNGLTPYDLIRGVVRPGTFGVNRCQFTGLGSLNLSDLANGDDQLSRVRRAYLFDHFLARTFSAKLESKLGVDAGTFRNMAINPRQAGEIALTQGINKVADQLFGKSTRYADPGVVCRNAIVTHYEKYENCGRAALRQAFLAGFYDTTYNRYTLNFSTERSLALLTQVANTMVDEGLAHMGYHAIGAPITRADALAIAAGDTTTIFYFGAQWYITDLNRKLNDIQPKDGDPQRVAYFNQVRRQLMISYHDVRAAFDTGRDSRTVVGRASLASKASVIRAEYGCYAAYSPTAAGLPVPDICSKNDTDTLAEFYADDPTDEAIATVEGTGSAVAQALRARAQENLQYRVYDILAFQTDQNIPPGFVRAMLKGSAAAKTRMLGLYAVNALKLDQALFGKAGLTPVETLDVITFALNGFREGNGVTFAKLRLSALGKLDQWLVRDIGPQIGIKDLPSGLMTGFVAWGMTGFDPGRFTDEIDIPGVAEKVPAIGLTLRGYAYEKLLAWSDKTLHFQPGTSYQIYKAYTEYRNAVTPKEKLAAKGALITLVITSVFDEELARIEQQLGLVPGSSGMAVSMLVDAILGVPINPLTVALFIGVNLFGVYSVRVETFGSADGIYPFTGSYSNLRDTPYEHPVPASDDRLGVFNAQNEASYRLGLKTAAQAKVRGLLADLLVFPPRWQAMTGEDPYSVWIPQIYTLRQEDTEALSFLIDQPAPWECDGTGEEGDCFGYGAVDDRGEVEYNEETNDWTITPSSDYRAGVFYDTSTSHIFTDHLHISWGVPSKS